jgi:regulator of protease activity HflC (stomatin/prohibitin superfamily)
MRPIGPVLLAIILTACGFAHIGAGEVGVRWTRDGIEQSVYPPGEHHIGVFDNMTTYSVRSQEKEERLAIQSVDGLGITLDTSVRYHVVPAEAVALHQELGPDYYQVLIGPTLRSQARRVVGRFKPEEIYSTQRELIERQIREGLTAAIAGRHVQIEAVLVRNVQLPDAIQQKITQKLAAEQEALQMKYELAKQEAQNQLKQMQANGEKERAQTEVEIKALQAEAEAKRVHIAAEADADAKRIDGTATADYNRAIEKSLTPQVLRLREIDASKALATSPNAKLVLMGSGGAHPLLDLRDVAATAPASAAPSR